jgi:hypothetical protein
MTDTAVLSDEPRYTFRRSLLEPEKTYVLSGGELVITSEGAAPQRIPLSAVQEVKLRFHRTRSWTAHQCFVGFGQGRRMVLQDLDFKGIADAASRGPAYSGFVRALHAALAQHGGAVRYRAGSIFSFIGGMVAAVVMAGMLAVALMMRWWLVSGLAALVLLRLAPTIPRSRPVTYTPDRIPEKLLPR